MVKTGCLYKKQSGTRLFIAKIFQFLMSWGTINIWRKPPNKIARLPVKVENNISQVAFNQKLFFAEEKESWNFCFWNDAKVMELGSTQSGCSYGKNFPNFSATTLVTWKTFWVEQDVTSVGKLLSPFCSSLLHLFVFSKMFWGLIITITIFSNVIGA